jgi:hypothetical protein
VRYFIILLLSITVANAQHTFTDVEVLNISNKISNLQRSDSLKSIQIGILDSLVNRLEMQSILDSTLISEKDIQIRLLHDRELLYNIQIDLVKPKWYHHRYLWFTYGFGTLYISVKAVGRI